LVVTRVSFLRGLQFRTAQRLAEKLNQNLEDKKVDSSEVGRHFGASVPVFGSRCEAPVFRNELEPAEPVQRFRPPMFRSGIEVSNIPKKPISILKVLVKISKFAIYVKN